MKVYSLTIDAYRGCAFASNKKTEQALTGLDLKNKDFVSLSDLEKLLKEVENESEGDKSTIDRLKFLMKIYKGNNYERKS